MAKSTNHIRKVSMSFRVFVSCYLVRPESAIGMRKCLRRVVAVACSDLNENVRSLQKKVKRSFPSSRWEGVSDDTCSFVKGTSLFRLKPIVLSISI